MNHRRNIEWIYLICEKYQAFVEIVANVSDLIYSFVKEKGLIDTISY